MKRIVVLFLFFIAMIPSFGQQGGLYPDQLSSYFFNPSLINPAYIQQKGTSEAIVQSKLRSGFYKDISTISASAQKVFNTQNNQWHSGRILLQNEKEGPYISTPRFYGNYGIRIGIGENTALMGGVSLGLVNPNFRTPTKSVSSTLLDGALGFMFQSAKVAVGFSSNQIFNSSSDNSRFISLKRFYTTQLNAVLLESDQVEVNSYFLWTYYTDISSQFNGVISVFWNDWLEVGGGYRIRQGTLFLASITLDKTSLHPIRMGLLYNSVILNTTNMLGESIEIILSYSY
jgi:hypothetical protein